MDPNLNAFTRGIAALSIAAATVLPAAAAPLELQWSDLIPAGSGQVVANASGLVDHTAFARPGAPPPAEALTAFLGPRPEAPVDLPVAPPVATRTPAIGGVRSDLDGTDITLAGYLLPLSFDGLAVTEFLLVPYVGACIHVPRPPANQIVLVNAASGVEITGLFDPVRVTGRLAVSALSTDLAEVGYRIDNADVMLIAQ